MFTFKIGSLSSDVFERRTSTESGLFALLSRDFEHIFGQMVSITVKKNMQYKFGGSRHIKRGKGSLPVDVRRPKMYFLKPTTDTDMAPFYYYNQHPQFRLSFHICLRCPSEV